ncbi:cytochrome c [Methylocystis sp. H62]|uniref:cytochrome c n=1 Tax=Methylocystis sp. H62 TaxID=2785789 RepID=UPI0018C2FCE4|nr:cytochrome c [Methylocystis sp. H62]MBG0794865.1 cytochrome c [Methylocystis sp. H62]
MGRFLFAAACGLSLFAAAAIAGDDTDDHSGHMKQMNIEHMKMSPKMSDTRQEVDLPAPMRAHMLANMRGHAEAVAEILAALGKGDGAAAAKVANAHLSMASPGAAACKPNAKSGELGDMPAMMAHHMPDEMRALGLTMHEQASKFAQEAAKIGPGGDMRPALAELSQVVQACNACHATYRLD